jgi:hypothetical protein
MTYLKKKIVSYLVCFGILCFMYLFVYSVQDTPLEKLDKKHFAKGSRGSEPNGGAATSKEVDNSKEIALMEAKINKLCDLLDEVSCGANVPCFSSILLISITLRFNFLLTYQIFCMF